MSEYEGLNRFPEREFLKLIKDANQNIVNNKLNKYLICKTNDTKEKCEIREKDNRQNKNLLILGKEEKRSTNFVSNDFKSNNKNEYKGMDMKLTHSNLKTKLKKNLDKKIFFSEILF
jgi:hypothetical protein